MVFSTGPGRQAGAIARDAESDELRSDSHRVADALAQALHGRVHAVRSARQGARVAAVKFKTEPRRRFLKQLPVGGVLVAGVHGILQIHGVELQAGAVFQ